jgi:diaminopimelate decarboxylase
MIDPIDPSLTDWSSLDTPCFVFDEPELRANLQDFDGALKQAWSPLARVAFSTKTNPCGWVLDVVREEGCMAETVSADEFDVALKHGFAPQDVIFNGQVKPRDWLEYALANGTIINLDSARDTQWTLEWAKEHPGQAHVGVRANIDLNEYFPGETITGDRGGRFGYGYKNGELARVVQQLRDGGVDVCGLHTHVTTLSRTVEVYKTLATIASEIITELGLDLRWVDMGGGYFGGGKKNEGAYERYANAMSDILRKVVDPQKCALYVEPGGAIVSTPARYVGKVVDVKDTEIDRFVTCELSRLNIDHELKKTSYPMHVLRPDGTPKEQGKASADAPLLKRQVLCGFSGLENDRLCVLEDWPELHMGDVIYIDYAGAYSMCFTPEFFIEFPPAVYKRDAQGVCTVIRPTSRPHAPSAK